MNVNLLATFVSILAGIAGMVFGLAALNRSRREDNKQDTAEMTKVLVKLENISDGVNEIKGELCNLKLDVKELRERVIITEQSSKQAHRRIDRLEASGE